MMTSGLTQTSTVLSSNDYGWNQNQIQGYWPQSNYYMTSSATSPTEVVESMPHFYPYVASSSQVYEKSIQSIDDNRKDENDENEEEEIATAVSNKKKDTISSLNHRSLEIRIPEFTSNSAKNSINNPKLSYTPFQLELLNMIYSKWKHPKAEQKTFIAQCVGITRKQTMVYNLNNLYSN